MKTNGENGKKITHVDIDHEQISPHKLPTTVQIPSLPESQQPRLDTEEHLPDFNSEKKTFELAMKKFREMKYSRDDYRRKKIAERFREHVWQRRYTYLFIGRGTTTPLLRIWNIIATTDLTEANRRNNLRLASVGFREVEVGNGP
ncbi:hypothetical protein Bca4012_062724 [Brassica carinata]|uniref:Uncharacterized protein n=1 Tax=Brassica carinata TaxID=52824 RepID=A0A8X7QJD2_BRACI|nr:hypothetical protein Bca52824_064265 [Brassica carinata]